MTSANISLILLAAGLSSRMQMGHKLLLPFGEHTLIEETLSKVTQTTAFEKIVVIGHNQEELLPILNSFGSIQVILNPNYKEGLTSSIQKGVSAASKDSRGFMLCLADLPFIAREDYQHVLDAFSNQNTSQPLIARAVFKKKYGHPVIFSHHFKNDILEHKSPEGCREIIKANAHSVLEVNMATDSILKDVDTNSDYEKYAMKKQESKRGVSTL